MIDKVRLAVIGLGAQGRQHIASFGLGIIDNAELSAVVDVVPEVSDQLGKQHSTRAFGDLDTFFKAAPELADGVIVSVPNKFHCDVVLQALSVGLHVLVEKRLPCRWPRWTG